MTLTPTGAPAGRDRFLGWVTHLVHEHRSRLVRVARREGLGPEDALDCVQDAFQSFLVLPQARLLAEDSDDAVKILTVLARNQARNKRRRHAVRKPHLDADTMEGLAAETRSVEQVVSEAEDYVMMVGCAATLSQIQRTVVELRLLDDVPGEEAAKMLGIAPGNLAVLLHRAKEKLRRCFVTAQ